ncbi:hypothetical protein SBOR_1831 [Sclerotinia borealis F-4128]|uniref:Uncharacterized protein n=1 Tax=Sclerotinia borealis (strain F-4128) TaxID=1432307 RepID=W9CM35_SCLBF|nr:hypothetical protein SBOR_1831 [Sclerotinia borealis F-4128]
MAGARDTVPLRIPSSGRNSPTISSRAQEDAQEAPSRPQFLPLTRRTYAPKVPHPDAISLEKFGIVTSIVYEDGVYDDDWNHWDNATTELLLLESYVLGKIDWPITLDHPTFVT